MRLTIDTKDETLDDVLRVVHAAYGVGPADSSNDTKSASGGTPAAATRRTTKPRRSAAKATPAVVRKWAADNGYTVSSRGALPKDVTDAFAAQAR